MIIDDDHNDKSVAFSSSIRHVPFSIDKLQLLLSYSHADGCANWRLHV